MHILFTSILIETFTRVLEKTIEKICTKYNLMLYLAQETGIFGMI